MDPNKKLNTALLKAAIDNSEEEVALLLDNPGVDVNVALDNGMTVLLFAANEGHLEVVALLLKHPGVLRLICFLHFFDLRTPYFAKLHFSFWSLLPYKIKAKSARK